MHSLLYLDRSDFFKATFKTEFKKKKGLAFFADSSKVKANLIDFIFLFYVALPIYIGSSRACLSLDDGKK